MAAAVAVRLRLPLMDTLREEQAVKSSFETLISCLLLDSLEANLADSVVHSFSKCIEKQRIMETVAELSETPPPPVHLLVSLCYVKMKSSTEHF